MNDVSVIRSDLSERLTRGFQENGFDELKEVLASLGLYACEVAVSAGISGTMSHAQGVILIRSLSEIYILTKHISGNSEAAARYREYGAGRARLITTRIQESGEAPNYLFSEELSAVANERRAEMFVDMPINGFYKKSIRDTSIESGAKEIYDAYYDIGSMYAHAEWGGVATSAVQMCGNALHLGHYIPSQRMFEIEMLSDVHWLLAKIGSTLGVDGVSIPDVPNENLDE